ncbi:MAG: peptidylprolyl isomerase [Parcubacteria group bacterium]|nr:peptidylprolyl isomerase [Parcubacteria group bacterium]
MTQKFVIAGAIVLVVVGIILFFISNNQNNVAEGENPVVVLKTTKGNIEIELFMDTMPITAGNFLKLAREGFYNGIKFHRVIKDFMIQGGDPLSKGDNTATYGTGGPGYAIEDEFVKGISNVRGTISMANSGPNTGGSQFFINLVDNVNLDFDKEPLTSKHPVFGRVVSGMEVVDAIGNAKTGERDIPVTPVVIETIEIKE